MSCSALRFIFRSESQTKALRTCETASGTAIIMEYGWGPLKHATLQNIKFKFQAIVLTNKRVCSSLFFPVFCPHCFSLRVHFSFPVSRRYNQHCTSQRRLDPVCSAMASWKIHTAVWCSHDYADFSSMLNHHGVYVGLSGWRLYLYSR